MHMTSTVLVGIYFTEYEATQLHMIIRCASALHVRPAGAGELSQRKAERRRG